MKTLYSIPALIVSAALTGCVGVGPNTQQGAVTGGTLGAIAGAVIGHNSAGGDALGGAILGGTAGALAGGALGNSVDQQRGTLYDARGGYIARRPAMRVASAPPAPLAENVPPPPSPAAVWVPGYWSSDGRAYSWIGGHWEIPPDAAHTYVAGHWESQGPGVVFVPGGWR